MLGEFSDGRARFLPKGFVLVSAGPRRGTVAGLQRRLRARDTIPATGQIVFRAAANQTLR
jgi:hypothetical protein